MFSAGGGRGGGEAGEAGAQREAFPSVSEDFLTLHEGDRAPRGEIPRWVEVTGERWGREGRGEGLRVF